MTSVPRFFDLQVNGYVGVDFQDDSITVEDLHRACAAMRGHGVVAFLATVITQDIDVMCRRLRRLVRLRERDELAREMIVGIHIEGPFISPIDGYRGAHLKRCVR